MSSPSWITPVRFAPRPAFLRPQFATDFAGREKFGAQTGAKRGFKRFLKRAGREGDGADVFMCSYVYLIISTAEWLGQAGEGELVLLVGPVRPTHIVCVGTSLCALK